MGRRPFATDVCGPTKRQTSCIGCNGDLLVVVVVVAVVGTVVGTLVGTLVGTVVGTVVGTAVGTVVGTVVGTFVVDTVVDNILCLYCSAVVDILTHHHTHTPPTTTNLSIPICQSSF